MRYIIKKATVSDIPLIRDLTFRIWPSTYGSLMPKEQLDYMLDLLYNEKTLAGQMEQGHDFVLLYENDQPIGFASTGLLMPGVFKLHKLYILPTGQGKGTGRFFLEEIINRVKANGATSIQLNVKRDNKAKGFYEKLGFSILKEEDIDIGNGYFMRDYVMSKAISY
jgi:ribosomal protein S18 acetylase RimI-like enzyme